MSESYDEVLVKMAQQITDIDTMYALIRGIERRGPNVPVEAYSRGIGTIALLSLGFSRKEQREEKIQYLYRHSIDRLRDAGLIEFIRYEHPGVMEARMSPTYAGYEWFEQKMPGKYREIIEEKIAEEERGTTVSWEMD
jgi:hypothetical protein